MLISNPPDDPGGNSASAGFTHFNGHSVSPIWTGLGHNKSAFSLPLGILSPTIESSADICVVSWARITPLVFSSQPMASPSQEASGKGEAPPEESSEGGLSWHVG
jgi:hypothetical protein